MQALLRHRKTCALFSCSSPVVFRVERNGLENSTDSPTIVKRHRLQDYIPFGHLFGQVSFHKKQALPY